MRKPMTVFILLLFVQSLLHSQQVLLAVRPDFEANSDRLYALDPTTYNEVKSFSLAIQGGPAILGMNGVAVHPTTNELFVVAKLDGFSGKQRRLLKVNGQTGAATIIGNLGDAFSSLVFASDGTLYGLTGDGANNPETLYTIDPTTAAITLHTPLGNGTDGEAMAYNPDDGLIYHSSGLGNQNIQEIFETIDVSGVPGTVTNIPLSGDDHEEITAIAYIGGGQFLAQDVDTRLSIISSTGAVTNLGQFASGIQRGYALAPISVLTPPSFAVPTTSEWGLIIMLLLVLSLSTESLMKRQMELGELGSFSTTSQTMFLFDKKVFCKMLTAVILGLVVLFAVAMGFFNYEMTNADVPGSLVAGLLLAYLIHLFPSKNAGA